MIKLGKALENIGKFEPCPHCQIIGYEPEIDKNALFCEKVKATAEAERFNITMGALHISESGAFRWRHAPTRCCKRSRQRWSPHAPLRHIPKIEPLERAA